MTIPPLSNQAPPAGQRQLDHSSSLLERARRCIPGVTTSMMKRPEQFAPGRFPAYLATGSGARVTDVDGTEYVDFICGLGATALGLQPRAVSEAIKAAVDHGVLHSLPTELEVVATERLLAVWPGADMARFFKTGADATSAAVRLARAITNRSEIVCVGYNGWHDHFMFDTPGVPSQVAPLTHRIQLQSPQQEEPLLRLLEERHEHLAALLISVPYNRVLSQDFVQRIREVCTKTGVLLIADEIVTGFRLALGGMQQFFGIQADLSCISKALAAGMPLSAVAGPRRYMERMTELQVSTTFGGEQLSLAACIAAIDVYAQSDYIQHIAHLGRRLKAGVNAAATRVGSPLRVVGYDPIPMFLFSTDMAIHARQAQPFVAELAKRGFLLRRDVNFISLAHTEQDIDALIDAAADSLEAISKQSE